MKNRFSLLFLLLLATFLLFESASFSMDRDFMKFIKNTTWYKNQPEVKSIPAMKENIQKFTTRRETAKSKDKAAITKRINFLTALAEEASGKLSAKIQQTAEEFRPWKQRSLTEAEQRALHGYKGTIPEPILAAKAAQPRTTQPIFEASMPKNPIYEAPSRISRIGTWFPTKIPSWTTKFFKRSTAFLGLGGLLGGAYAVSKKKSPNPYESAAEKSRRFGIPQDVH